MILLALIASQTLAKSVVVHNTKIPTEFYNYKDLRGFNAMQLHVGSGREKVHKPANFLFDIGYSKFLIGQKEKFGKGIECTDGKSNSCEVTEEPQEVISYLSKVFTVSKGITYFSLDSNIIQTSKPDLVKAKISLIEGKDSWYLNDWGVMGIAPQGEFSKYFSQLYESPINVLPLFTKRSDLGFDMKMYLNPHFIDGQVMTSITLPEDALEWRVKGSSNFINEDYSFEDKQLFITNQDENILLVIDGMDRCYAVMDLVCPGVDHRQCTKDKSDISKAPELKIVINNVEFKFTNEEYVYFDSENKLNCRWGDIEAFRDQDAYQDTEYGIGTAFLAKYPAVFMLDQGKASTVKFLNSFSIPNPSNFGFKVLLILAIAVFIIGGYLVYMTLYKNKTEPEAGYTQV